MTAQKTKENEILRQGYQYAVDDLKRAHEIIGDYKLANELLEMVLYWQGKTIKAQGEELICWRMRSGN